MATTKRASEAGRQQREKAPQLAVKSQRLGTRVTPAQKEILQRAADLTGRSVTDFVISSALDKAQDTIYAYEFIALSERDARAFFEALQNPPRLNHKMGEAMRWHRENVEMR